MTKKKITRITAYVILVFAVVAVMGIIAKFTSGFTSDFKTFYVTVNGKDVMSSSGGYSLSVSEPMKIDVKYVFGFMMTGNKDYTVKIVPNKVAGKDFTVYTGEESIEFQSVKDLSAGFIIKKDEKSFTVTPKADTLTGVMKSIYPETDEDFENKGYEDMFKVVITSYNGEASVSLYFTVSGTVTGVKLDKEAMEF